MEDDPAGEAAERIAAELHAHRDGLEQEATVSRGVVPPVTGRPVVKVCRFDPQRGAPQPDDPKLILGVIAQDNRLTGFVVDMQIGPRRRGIGKALWREVAAVAGAAGLQHVDLEAQELGGWFWAREGFEFTHPQGDATALVQHMGTRAAALANAGHPIDARWTNWLRHPGAPASLQQAGLQELVKHLPRDPVPELDEHGHAGGGVSRTARAVLLAHSRWTGRRRLP